MASAQGQLDEALGHGDLPSGYDRTRAAELDVLMHGNALGACAPERPLAHAHGQGYIGFLPCAPLCPPRHGVGVAFR